MRLDRDRVVRVLLIAAPALGLFWMLRGPWWAHEWELHFEVLGAAALLGLVARALDAKGYVRTAKGLGLTVIGGATALAVYRIEAWDGVDAVAEIVRAMGPLAVATYAVRSTRDGAGFAVGAALMALASWYFWPGSALVVLGFVVGRDALGGTETTARHALSQVGAGVLCMFMVSGIGFDLEALLIRALRPETPLSRAYVDGAGTYVPRLVVEVLFVVACLGHARGRTWGVLALGVLAPVLVELLARTRWLPAMGGGCITWGHPLDELGAEPVGVFEVAVAIAVVPWIAPIARTVRSRSETRT